MSRRGSVSPSQGRSLLGALDGPARTPSVGSDVIGSPEVERMRVRRDALAEAIEVEELQTRLDTLRRRREEGLPPARRSSFGDGSTKVISSVRSASTVGGEGASYITSSMPNRLKLRELEIFKGKNLTEAREFIRALELVFALTQSYTSDEHKVLYRVMFLVGEPRKL